MATSNDVDAAALRDDVRLTLARHGHALHVDTSASRGMREFWRILVSLQMHAPATCASRSAAAAAQRCLLDGCSTVFAARRGDEQLLLPACYLVDAVATALTPGHTAWTPFHDACATADDVPRALLDVLLMHPPAYLGAVFPQMRTNVWRRVVGDPAADTSLSVPDGIAALVNVLARAFPCYSASVSGAEAEADAAFEQVAKRMRRDPAAETPGDGTAAALLHIVGPMLIRESVARTLAPPPQGLAEIAHSAVYTALWRACAVAELTRTACTHILSDDCPDLFHALKDAFGVFDVVVRAREAEMGRGGGGETLAPVVRRCRVLQRQPLLLPVVKRIADACSARVANALLEGLRRGGAEDAAAEFARTRSVVVIEGAAYGDALLLCRAAWAGLRVPETQCIQTDSGVVCILPAADGIRDGAALHALVVAARHPHFEGTRYPVYGALARLYFSRARGAAWALAILAALEGASVPCAAPAVGDAALAELLPDFVDALVGSTPLFLLVGSAAHRDLRRVLGRFVRAAALGAECDLAPVAAPVRRLAKAVNISTEHLVHGPGALCQFAALCLRALAAGAVAADAVVRLLAMLFPDSGGAAPAAARRWTGALELQGSPLVAAGDAGALALDADGRRRAAAMLKLFALYDCPDAGLDAAEADAHLDATCDALNLDMARAAPSDLGWHFPVFCAADGALLLYDHEVAVLPRAPPAALDVFGAPAAGAVAAAPIPDCAALVADHANGTAASRFALGRQLDLMYEGGRPVPL